MYVEEVKSVKKGKRYCSTLIRQTYREDGKVKHRTLANISKLPPKYIYQIKKMLSGNNCDFNSSELEFKDSREYGGSYAFLELCKITGLENIIYSRSTAWRKNALAMIVGRILYQGSKLSLTNLYKDTCLWDLCGHANDKKPVVEKACYETLDKLLSQQQRIQQRLAKRHLSDGCLILYDMTNIWLEGEYENSELASYGREKSGKRGYKQISVGMLTNNDGCPVAVKVFNGNISEQTTVKEQVDNLLTEYGVKKIIFAGDRGMLTPRRIEEVNKAGFNTLTALTHPQIMNLLENKTIQLELFDERKIIEVVDPDNSNIRYMLCRNPDTEKKERATRDNLIATVSEKMNKISAVKRKRDHNKVAARIGSLMSKYRVGKFFNWQVNENGQVEWSVDSAKVELEQSIDGCYIIRTDVSDEIMSTQDAVAGYKRLQNIEKAFRNLKTVSLEMRPVYHKTDDRIRAHVFLCMLAYYLQWHANNRLKSLFDNDKENSERRWSINTVIERLKSIRKVKCYANDMPLFEKITIPDDEQKLILELLGVTL